MYSVLVAVVVFIALMFYFSRTAGNNVRDRLERMAPVGSGYDLHNPDTDFLNQGDEKTGAAQFGEQLMRMIGKDVKATEKTMQMRFIQAGIDSPNAVAYFYLFRFFMLPLAFMVSFSLYNTPAQGMEHTLYMMGVAGVPLLAWYLPNIYLKNSKQKRQKVLQRSFPDTLDLILVCVESGLALDAALARVCRELGRAHPEITKELNRTRMELTLLSDRAQALQNLGERTDLTAFRSLIAALLQTERFGTSLTETLRVLSDDYRHERLMVAENKAGKLPALMTVPMILLMMPAFIMIIMGPAIIQFNSVWSSTSIGQ